MINLMGIKKNYDDVQAVNGIDCKIPDGQFIGLLGPNGAGKTTTIKMMIGLLEASEGQIMYDNLIMSKKQVELKKSIGVVSQHINLDKELSVYENMIFAGKLYKMPKNEILDRTDLLLKKLDLFSVKDRPTKKLSGGMKRKLMIAKALIHNPSYIFLDEPTVGIDVHARKEIWRFLKQHHQEGKTIVLTTHYIEEAEQLCDRLLLIDKGKVFKDDTSDKLIAELGAYKIEQDDKMYFFDSIDQANEGAKNIKGIYNVSATSLEDVFYHYTKEAYEWKS